jgi:hypothetical protein
MRWARRIPRSIGEKVLPNPKPTSKQRIATRTTIKPLFFMFPSPDYYIEYYTSKRVSFQQKSPGFHPG